MGEISFEAAFRRVEAKTIFSKAGLPTPKGKLAEDRQQAYDAAAEIGAPVAVKAQVLVAGRGKAGGILFADMHKQAQEAWQKLLGSRIKGEVAKTVLVENKNCRFQSSDVAVAQKPSEVPKLLSKRLG
ncbi:MAG: acetate--CoA ligase family protein [Candidatus Bathyarchaeota archaeon]|nr:acetate--CoA ligase family protein [Candidatus Bathyarchaeota archaeon]